jgi:hypothetical protein
LRRDDLGIGQAEPGSVVETDERQAMGGQRGIELTGETGSTAA